MVDISNTYFFTFIVWLLSILVSRLDLKHSHVQHQFVGLYHRQITVTVFDCSSVGA